MKKQTLYLGLAGCILFALCTRLQAQTTDTDSLQIHRYVTRATMYGVGFTNVFDTYLSPQEYKGIDFRVSRETIRMTKLELRAPLSVPSDRELQTVGRRIDRRQRRFCLQSSEHKQPGFGTGIYQSGCIGNGYLASENQTLSGSIALSSEFAGNGSHVFPPLRTILL